MLSDTARLKLPPQYTRETNSANELVAVLSGLKRPIDDVTFTSAAQQRSLITGIEIGNLVLHEARTDAAVARLKIDPKPSFIIPLLGGIEIREKGSSMPLPANTHITALSAVRPMEFRNRRLHLLGIRPDLDALNEAVSAIMGDREDLARITSLDGTAAHPGRMSETDYIEQLLSLVSVVNGTNGDLSLLNRIGIADIFTRVLAEFLVESVTGAAVSVRSEPGTRSMAAVDMICSHIEDNVGKPLTVIKMEKLTGMTGRSLNYAFHQRFGCSPQQWQRRYLLDRARTRLLDPESLTSVKAVAYELGFASSASFATHYRRRFGEKPSVTQANALFTARHKSAQTEEID